MRKFWGILLILALLPLTALGMHEEKACPGLIMEAELGYGGLWTYGQYMPLTVRLRNEGEDFEGTLAMNGYVSTREYDRWEVPVSLPRGAEKEFHMTVRILSRQDVYTLELCRGEEQVMARNFRYDRLLNPSAMLVGVCARDPRSLGYLEITREGDELHRGEIWQTIPLTMENFPVNRDEMSAFGMLVVDGTDLRQLTDRQQEILLEWLEKGGILLEGTGTEKDLSHPFFRELTGLETGEVREEDALSPILSDLKQKHGDMPGVWTSPLLKGDREQGALVVTPVGEGRIYTLSFSPGQKEISGVPEMHTLFQRLLLKEDPELYLKRLRRYQEMDYGLVDCVAELPVTGSSSLIPGIAVVAGTILLALLAFLIFRRRGRGDRMWLVYPLLFTVSFVLVLVFSTRSGDNREVMLSIGYMRQSPEKTRVDTYVDVAAAQTGEHRAGGGQISPFRYDAYDSYGEEDSTVPQSLRYRFAQDSAGYRTESPWTQQIFTVSDIRQDLGKMEGVIWMEGDGLHGEIHNGMDRDLSAGMILTPYGYLRVPELKRGESFPFALTRSTPADPRSPVYLEGFMYEQMAMNGDMGQSVAAWRRGEQAAEARFERSVLSSLQSRSYSAYDATEMGTQMYYVTFLDEIGMTELTLDGHAPQKREHRGVLRLEMEWLMRGRSGVICLLPGQLRCERWEVTDSLEPGQKAMQSGDDYTPVRENPVFRFDLGEWKDARIERLLIHIQTYDDNLKEYLWNHEAQAWDEVRLSEEIRDTQKYLGRDGELYVQVRSGSGEMTYVEIPLPVLSMEGRDGDA